MKRFWFFLFALSELAIATSAQQTLELENTTSTELQGEPQTTVSKPDTFFGGLTLGVHSRVGLSDSFVGLTSFYDKQVDLDLSRLDTTALSKDTSVKIGLLANMEFALNQGVFGNAKSIRVGGGPKIFLASALGFVGFDMSSVSSLRIGAGVVYSSAWSGFESIKSKGISPTGIVTATLHPNLSGKRSFGLNCSIRLQNKGVMFTVSPGIIQSMSGR